ncbi:phage tail protein [Evansella tamaricis]|uniref:Phage tail tape measure protein n=1 Tax=Evansella tamaricis TaxID=2069301 RepID=A0ABS6JMI5_9BACI|nr:hypothetical protein [Evansella tamaricis]MBU9714414.1 hypothetical protein [Evansella tamaricis]
MSKQYNVVTNLIAKTDSFVNGMKDASQKTESFNKNFSKKMTDVGKKMTDFGKKTTALVTLPLVGIGAGLIKVASDAEEMRGKFSVVFDGMEQEMRDFAAESADAWGRSQIDIEGYLSSTQNMLVGMGMARDEGADLSKQIVSLGVDLASFNNLAESDALRNLESAISGNHTAAQSLGAVINENTIAVEMERMGLQGKFQDLSEAEKMQVRYNTILSQSTDAVGDAERTSGSFANQMRRLTGQVKDVSADFGELLLPMATKVVEKVGDLVTWFGNLDGSTKKIILIMGGVAAVIPPIIMVLGMLATAIGAIGLPVALIVGAIAGFIAILTSAYATNEEFRDRVNNAFQNVKDFVSNAIQFIRDFWDTHGQAILDKGMEVFNKIQEVVFTVMDAVVNFVQEKLEVILDFWNEHGEQIMEAVQNVFAFIQEIVEFVMPIIISIIETAWKLIKNAFDFALNTILSLVKFFASVFTGDWQGAMDALKSIWDGALKFIKGLVQIVLNFIGDFIGKIINKYQDLFSAGFEKVRQIVSNLLERIKNAILSPIEAARDSVSNLLSRISGFFSDSFEKIQNRADKFKNGFIKAWEGIRDGVKKPINGIIGFANSVLGGWEKMINGIGNAIDKIPSFSTPDWIPGIGGKTFSVPSLPKISLPKIPALAEGGIATDAVLSLIGEGSEHEAIMPLSKLFGMMDSFADTVFNRLVGSIENMTDNLIRSLSDTLSENEYLQQNSNQTIHFNPRFHFEVKHDKLDHKTLKEISNFVSRQTLDYIKLRGG